jgi:hypothetical protein
MIRKNTTITLKHNTKGSGTLRKVQSGTLNQNADALLPDHGGLPFRTQEKDP